MKYIRSRFYGSFRIGSLEIREDDFVLLSDTKYNKLLIHPVYGSFLKNNCVVLEEPPSYWEKEVSPELAKINDLTNKVTSLQESNKYCACQLSDLSTQYNKLKSSYEALKKENEQLKTGVNHNPYWKG